MWVCAYICGVNHFARIQLKSLNFQLIFDATKYVWGRGVHWGVIYATPHITRSAVATVTIKELCVCVCVLCHLKLLFNYAIILLCYDAMWFSRLICVWCLVYVYGNGNRNPTRIERARVNTHAERIRGARARMPNANREITFISYLNKFSIVYRYAAIVDCHHRHRSRTCH